MQTRKNEAGNSLPLIVTEGVTVNVMPNEAHEYLMTTKEVAHGYGTTKYAIQQAFHRNSSEFIDGKHFVTALTICQRDSKLPHNAILFTKRGIVRLGFFIKSERAKLFRDWAEELIITVDQQRDLFGQPATRALPARRNHNRLTQERLVDILADVCRIDDRDLRISLTAKLIGGNGYGNV